MADETNIEWADSTFNPWIGCMKVSPACDHCYAAAMMDDRYGRVEWGEAGKGPGERKRTSAANWRKPLQWQKQAAAFLEKHGRRRRVFCASLADVFDSQVPGEWRDDLWRLIEATPDLIWMLLTKRPQNIAKMLPPYWDAINGRIWLGTTVEDQIRADQNIPHLLKHDCAVRFVSCEPLLSSVDLTRIAIPGRKYMDGLQSYISSPLGTGGHFENIPVDGPSIDWIIAGGESGPHARPSHPDWFRSLRDQARDTGVSFLFKQWGEWLHEFQFGNGLLPSEHSIKAIHIWPGGTSSARIGKRRAGRLLDGVAHDGFPSNG